MKNPLRVMLTRVHFIRLQVQAAKTTATNLVKTHDNLETAERYARNQAAEQKNVHDFLFWHYVAAEIASRSKHRRRFGFLWKSTSNKQ